MNEDAAGIERAQQRFRRDIWNCAPDDAVQDMDVRSRRFGPVLATAFSALPRNKALNVIQGAAEPGAIDDGHLAEAAEWMRSREVEYAVLVTSGRPGSEPARQWLQERGYEPGPVLSNQVGAAGAVKGPDAVGIEVRLMPAEEDEGLTYLLTEGLGLPDMVGILFFCLPCLPNWRCYSALLEGQPAACGSMLLEGGIAILGLDATLSRARRRGCHRALLRRRLRDAAEGGCDIVVATAPSDPGSSPLLHSLQSLGFTEASQTVAWWREWR